VDKSLESKLNSLIFIPVISQTYCDPKSFAWQNEFKAFNKMASEDRLGRDIRLASGNVCSRIIPIKIHELDGSDTELLENEMGCRLRSIDFIYSSTGVNRPLKPDDNPEKNLHKTYYRDQINKVANAIKEIIYSLHPDEKKRISKTYQVRESAVPRVEKFREIPEATSAPKRMPVKLIILSVILALIVVVSAILVPNLFNKNGNREASDGIPKKSIAILPVSNLTGDGELQYIADGIHVDINTLLGSLSNLIVRPAQTTLQFRNSSETVREIAKKLSVNTLILSSLKGTKDKLQLTVQVVEAFPEDKSVWSHSYDYDWETSSEDYKDIIDKVASNAEIKLTAEEANNLKLERKHNPALLEAYKQGSFYIAQLSDEDFRKGVKYLNDAIKIDPTDPLPYLGLALGYGNSAHAYGISPDAPAKAKAYAEKALEYNPNCSDAHAHYAWYLTLIPKIDRAISEMKKAVEIDPLNPFWQGYLAWLYAWHGESEEALKEAQKTFLLSNNYPMGCYVMGLAYSQMGMHNEAIEIQKKGLDPESKGIDYTSGYISGLGVAYAKAGMRDEALMVAKEMEKQNYYWHTWGLAEIYMALGEKDKVLNQLEAAYKSRHDFFPWIRTSPEYADLYDNPGFKEITGRVPPPED
jgi:TolB-like protein